MSPPRTDTNPNQDKNILGLEKYQCLPSNVPLFYSGIKSLRNEADDDDHETTDTSRPDKDDTSHTNRNDSIENLKSTKKTMMMTNTKRIIRKIRTVMKFLSTQQNNKRH